MALLKLKLTYNNLFFVVLIIISLLNTSSSNTYEQNNVDQWYSNGFNQSKTNNFSDQIEQAININKLHSTFELLNEKMNYLNKSNLLINANATKQKNILKGHRIKREHIKFFQRNRGYHPILDDHYPHQLTRNRSREFNRALKHAEFKMLKRLEDRFEIKLSMAEKFINEKLSRIVESERKLRDHIAHTSKLQAQLNSLNKTVETQKMQLDSADNLITELKQLIVHIQKEFEYVKSDKHEHSNADYKVPISKIQPHNRLPIDCNEAFPKTKQFIEGPSFNYATIQPILSPIPFQTSCLLNNSYSWTIIQRRIDGSVDFFRNWQDYVNGFGEVTGEFWLGNNHIYQLTNQGDYRLRIELETWDGDRYFAEYDYFRIADKADDYRLTLKGYSGNAGDSLTNVWENDHNGQRFSTFDRDNDERFYDNCAKHYAGGWWFNSCFQSHLNGLYYNEEDTRNLFSRNGIIWNSINPDISLKETLMMIRSNLNL